MSDDEVSLRPWTEDDLALEFRLMGDPTMTVYLGGPETEEQMRKRHNLFLKMNGEDKGRMYVIVVGPEQTPAGGVGYWETEWHDQTVWETGYGVLPEFQGRNLGTIGTRLVIEKARENGKHRYLHAFPRTDNGPSNAVCRKAGFTLMGEHDFEYPKGNPIRSNDWRVDLMAET